MDLNIFYMMLTPKYKSHVSCSSSEFQNYTSRSLFGIFIYLAHYNDDNINIVILSSQIYHGKK